MKKTSFLWTAEVKILKLRESWVLKIVMTLHNLISELFVKILYVLRIF
jgi:hypothetical protein